MTMVKLFIVLILFVLGMELVITLMFLIVEIVLTVLVVNKLDLLFHKYLLIATNVLIVKDVQWPIKVIKIITIKEDFNLEEVLDYLYWENLLLKD